MGKPTERALKRKPMAVILLTTERADVPEVPTAGKEYEWFETNANREKFFDANDQYHQEDTKQYDDKAYMAVEILDTRDMTLGRVQAWPDTVETKAWVEKVKADISICYIPLTTTDDASKAKAGTTKGGDTKPAVKAVRARRKSPAAKAVSEPKPDTEKATEKKPAVKTVKAEAAKAVLKDRLKEKAEKAAPQPEPKAAAPKKRAAARKRAPAKASA